MSEAFQNPSSMTDLTLSLVIATGVSRMDGTFSVPLFVVTVVAGVLPLTMSTAAEAAYCAAADEVLRPLAAPFAAIRQALLPALRQGSGGFVVFDEDSCIVKNTWNFARFYHHESCGQCSPCREGTGWMEKVLHSIEHGHGKMSDMDLLVDVAKRIEGNTICPLGDAAAWPVASAIRHFRDEFEWHVREPKESQIRNYGLGNAALIPA